MLHDIVKPNRKYFSPDSRNVSCVIFDASFTAPSHNLKEQTRTHIENFEASTKRYIYGYKAMANKSCDKQVDEFRFNSNQIKNHDAYPGRIALHV